MSFRPAPVRRAREQVEVQLREAILSGTFSSGGRLPTEMELAESFGVSRTTIREALGALASDGLISKVPGASGGSFVRVVDHESLGLSLGRSIDDTLKFGTINFEEINHVRRLLEVPSAREAARMRNDDDVEALRDIIERQKKAALEDPDEMASLDSRFHTKIAEASGNRVLASLAFALHSVIRQALFLNVTPEQGSAAVRQHIDLARGIANGDPDEAGKAMESHLDYLDQLQLWRKKPAI
ncbi:MAG: FadR family transcriptional regulator [Actinomycetota bacterium]|jgi:DNA-binding FadR family transcriptional regulator|nr:FadR family transcriptional regulator [Actinomycetota bacterium]